MGSFSDSVRRWNKKSEHLLEAIFKASVQDLVSELNKEVPVDTGFLRASLRASTVSMPVLSLDNPGEGSFNIYQGQTELVIFNAELGETVHLGYTAKYGAYVHYGADGRVGRPWVRMVAQKWQRIVKKNAFEIQSRLVL